MVPYLAAPRRPPARSSAAPGDRRISLTWQPPAELIDGSPAPGDLRYLVLRGAGAEGALAAITPKPVEATSFTDEGVDNDTDYRYAVRAVRVDPAVYRHRRDLGPGGRRRGGHHAARRARQPARGAVPRRGAAGLEPRAAHRTWRSTRSIARARRATSSRIATTMAIATVYLDRDVRPGATYRYAVTAIDRARRPNESARSNEISVRLP